MTDLAPHALRAFDDTTSHTTPEHRIMLATITNAIADAMGLGVSSNGNERDKVRREALAWFKGAGDDFQSVCHLAGLDPAATRHAVLTFLASGEPMPAIRRVTQRSARTANERKLAA